MCLVCACVIKCLIEVSGVVLLPALYFFWICVCLHMLCRKLYRETSVGETHHDNKTGSNRKNHEVREIMDPNHARQSLTRADPRVGHPASSMGRPAHHCTNSPHALSTVRFAAHTLYFHMFCFLFRTKLKIL